MKTSLKLTLILTFLTITLQAQVSEITNFPLSDTLNINHNLLSVQTNDTSILFVWQEGVQLVSSRTSDYGETWSDTTIITNRINLDGDANLLKMENGRILLTYKHNRHQLKYSDDDGLTWSDEIELPNSESVLLARSAHQSNLALINNKAWFTYASDRNNSNIYAYKIESSDGIAWDAPVDTLCESDRIINYPSVLSGKSDSLFIIYQVSDNINESGEIFQRTSTDNGNSWSSPIQITFTENNCFRPKVINDNNDDIYLFYELKTETQYPDYQHTDIYFSKFEESSNNWSLPQTYTQYVGDDLFHNVSTVDGKVYITFGSDRILREEPISYEPLYEPPEVEYHNSWYGFLDSEDLFTPPLLYSHTLTHFVNSPEKRSEVVAYGLDDDELNSITLFYSIDDNDEIELELFDDGLHFDSEPNDNIFGNEIEHDSLFDIMKYRFILEDNRSIVYRSLNRTDETFFNRPIDKYYFEINKIRMPINSHGIMADAKVGSRLAQGRYDEANFLYSGGFMMSGYADGNLWGNAVASSARIDDYLPGKIKEDTTVQNRIFILKKWDTPFGDKWQEWKDAVKLGARFHDGDYDGIYNPVDKNGNGQWDKGEDRPDLMGDLTSWCVYNDGVPSNERLFENVSPMGIEIRQTVFGYSPESFSELEGVIFIRYSIQNTGQFFETLDSVYFSHWSDPDLGNYYDDLVGYDIELNAGYVYNEENDDYYGINSPAFMVPLLQGPPVYIPGETFEDNNNNGEYDENIDTPITTAYCLNGRFGETKIYPGASIRSTTSFHATIKSHPTQSEPENEEQLRYVQFGLDNEGNSIDPCNWEFGVVNGMDCNSVNPIFMYSGDPVTNYGWVNTYSTDQRLMVTTGTFTLKAGEPIDIIIAYVVGRGEDPLNSITESRLIAENVHKFYKSNFTSFITDAELTENVELPTKFSLSQNYPNPFNPSTRIEYTIPSDVRREKSDVRLTVYDILGREVATLVNKEQKPGSYEVEFSGNHLSSGVYFYTLKTGNYLQTKKMLMLK